MRETIQNFIPCDCGVGGIVTEGIDFEDRQGVVFFYSVHAAGIGVNATFWQRIKDAWSILWGYNIRYNSTVLNHKGVTKLRDVCQGALDRWPLEKNEEPPDFAKRNAVPNVKQED